MTVYPNVPNVPGVPSLARNPQAAVQSVQPLSADNASVSSQLSIPRWGIYYNGSPALVSDSVIDLTFEAEHELSSYPLEGGAFESYNKVKRPFNAKLRFSQGGSVADRQAFLETLETLENSLTLYDVVMPERLFSSANVMHYDFRRTNNNGATLIVADVWLEQIRVTAVATFSQTKSPSGATPKSSGTVQTQTPTPTQAAVGGGGFGGASGGW